MICVIDQLKKLELGTISLSFDFLVRNKVGNTTMAPYNTIPVMQPDKNNISVSRHKCNNLVTKETRLAMRNVK